MNTQYYTIAPLDNYAWQPQGTVNSRILVDEGLTSNWKYRQYMQKNATAIMKYDTQQYFNASGNNPYTLVNNQHVQQNPYIFGSLYNDTQPPVVGSMTDLKQQFIQKQQMQARMISPSIPTKF